MGCGNSEVSPATDANVPKEEQHRPRSLTELLDSYPASVLTAAVSKEPEKSKHDDGEELVELEFTIDFKVDQTKYDAFIEELIPLLEKVATKSGEAFIRTQSAEYTSDRLEFGDPYYIEWIDEDRDRMVIESGEVQFHTPKLMVIPKNAFHIKCSEADMNTENELNMIVSTNSSATDERLTFRWFHIPNQSISSGINRIDVSLQNKAGKEMDRDFLSWEHLTTTPGIRTGVDESNDCAFAVISPFFMDQQRMEICRSIEIPRSMTLSAQQAENLAEIKCTVIP